MKSLKLGFFDNFIGEATASVIIRILEAHGINDIELITGDYKALMQELATGNIDLFVGVWLPDVHADMLQANPALKVIGNLYQPSVYLALPNQFKDWLQSIDKIKSADFLYRDIKVSETLYAITYKMMESYDFLGEYQLIPMQDEDAFVAYQEIINAGKPEIMVLHEPGNLNDLKNFYYLEDSKAILNREQKAVMLLNPVWVRQFGDDLIDELEEMILGNQTVQFLEESIRNQGMNADEAAEAWQRGKLIARI